MRKLSESLIHTILISSGFPVGIIANQLSVLNPTEAAKGAQFIRTCNQQYVLTIS